MTEESIEATEAEKPAAWLTGEEAVAGQTQVYSPNTGHFHLLDDAWITSRYAEEGEGPCVEIHTDGDAWTADPDETVTVRQSS